MAKFVLAFLAIVVVFAASAMAAVPTTCAPYKGDGIRCAKANAALDRVRVDSKTGERITYHVGFWESTCGLPGREYRNVQLESKKGDKPTEFDLGIADHLGVGAFCLEAIIYDCKVNNVTPINCNDALRAYRI